MRKLEIIHEDEICLVINKPAGLAVQGGKDVGISLDKLLAEIRPPTAENMNVPLLVHRLDKDTSGLILTAKTKKAAAMFSRLFESKIIYRQYFAVCLGKLKKNEGIIAMDLLIRGTAKKSETRYKVIEKVQGPEGMFFSVLELELGTGRMHQIRRHFLMTGNPILGDDKYGDFAVNKKLKKTMGLKKLLLHACRLVIVSKEDGLDLNLSAPVPEYFNVFRK